jgi:hypothetical protein
MIEALLTVFEGRQNSQPRKTIRKKVALVLREHFATVIENGVPLC